MLKTLLYVDEDLASSIALRFTDYLHKYMPLSLYVTHVEQLEAKENVGTGWIRHTWEDGICSSGKQLVARMLRTENIDCPLAGRPKVFIEEAGSQGERKGREVLYELINGMYGLFIKGYLDSANPELFYDLITSKLYQNSKCPMLVVKNLSLSKKYALLCADSVDPKLLVEKRMMILGESSFELDLVFFKFKENEELTLLGQGEGGQHLSEVEALLADRHKKVNKTTVLSGTPEQVGDYLKEYAVVVSTMPSRKSMRMYVLAHSLASVLLVR